jgi:probable phosphoglycerate mutase
MIGTRRMAQCLWLLRHGDTEWTESERHTGLADPRLSEAGRHQAMDAGRLLAGRAFTHVARRAELERRASSPAMVNLPRSNRYWSSGTTVSLKASRIARRADDSRAGTCSSTAPPGGERPGQIAGRADQLLAALADTTGACLLVVMGSSCEHSPRDDSESPSHSALCCALTQPRSPFWSVKMGIRNCDAGIFVTAFRTDPLKRLR